MPRFLRAHVARVAVDRAIARQMLNAFRGRVAHELVSVQGERPSESKADDQERRE